MQTLAFVLIAILTAVAGELIRLLTQLLLT